MAGLAAWLAGSVAVADDDSQALEEQLEEAEAEFDDLELDAAELEDWAEDELAERRTLRSLQRRAAAMQRRAAVRGWLPRISLAVGLDLPRDHSADRNATATAASEGSLSGPDDADRDTRGGLSWQITIRLVWNLPGLFMGGGATCNRASNGSPDWP